MIYSLKSINKYVYVNIHCEQIFKYSELSSKTLDNLAEENIVSFKDNSALSFHTIKSIKDNLDFLRHKGKSIILNFNYVHSIQNNMEYELSNLIAGFDEIVLFNIATGLIDSLKKCFKEKEFKTLYSEEKFIFYKKDEWEEFECINSEISEYVNNEIIKDIYEALDQCCDNKKVVLDSTPVYANKYINIKKMIEKENEFPFYMYLLAKKIIESNILNGKKVEIFCQTLNGVYIGSILSSILGIDMIYIDHIGPINHVKNNIFNNKIKENVHYLVVADVICLRSEIKAAKTLIEFLNGKYLGDISIVQCMSVKKPKSNSNNISLLTIEASNNPIKYELYTDLYYTKKE